MNSRNENLGGVSLHATIFPNVKFGKNVRVEDFCVIGKPPAGVSAGDLETVIGDNSVIRSHSVIYAGNSIGSNFQTGHHVLIRERNEIGQNVSVGSYSDIEHHVKIADGVRVHSKVFIPEYTEIKQDAWIGPGVMITNAPFPRSVRVKETLKGAVIESSAKIGANSILLPGVLIGSNSLVGAGSVVTRDVKEGMVVVGSPAKEIKMVSELRYKDTGELAYPQARSNTTGIEHKIPLVDLFAQYKTIKKDIDGAIERIIANSSFIMGPEVEKFEKAFAHYINMTYCVGVSNGTTALELSLRALGIQPSDEIITTPMSFIATSEAIVNVGALPRFVDVEEGSMNIDPTKISEAITPRTRAILPVHLYGQPADLTKIYEIATQKDLLVIEDAAQAHGAEYSGRKVPWQIGTFSFFPGKNLGAFGDAGAVVTNDEILARRIMAMRNHGRFDKYEHNMAGTNARMDALQAAILSAKLPYLSSWIEARRAIAGLYRQRLGDLPLILPAESPLARHVYHLFVVRTPLRDELISYLKDAGIAAGIHYPIPLHLQPVYRSMGYALGDFPVTERLSREIVSLPIYPELTHSDVDYICEKIRVFFREQAGN